MAGNGGGSLLPPELQACEWLETDGNSWINLPFNCNNITNINNFEGKSGSETGGRFFGLRKTSGRFFQLQTSSGFYFFRYFCTGGDVIQSNEPTTNWLKFSYNSDTKICKFNNEIITNTYSVEKNINLNISLFRSYINGAYTLADNGTQIFNFDTNLFSLYSCYIKSGNTYTDNKGVECAAGTAGMYDLTNGVFYTNDGTGSFTHGADIIL